MDKKITLLSAFGGGLALYLCMCAAPQTSREADPRLTQKEVSAGLALSGIGDQELLDQYAFNKSQVAFTELVRRHQKMVFATAYRICVNRSDAQDVTQHSFAVLARQSGDLTEIRSMGGWLHRVTTMEAIKVVRKNKSRNRRERLAAKQHEIDEDGESLARKISPVLDETLSTLKPKERDVVVMHYLDGQTFKRIAEQLGSSAEAVRKCCSRAIDKLGDRLNKRGVSVSAVALTTYLGAASQKSAAATAAVNLTQLASESMLHSAAKTTISTTISTLLITMKTGIIISILSGALLSVGWAYWQRDSSPETDPGLTDTSANHSNSSGETARSGRKPQFTMELVENAIAHYDSAYETDPYVENRLRSLMFLVPEKNLTDVLSLLEKVKNKPRFQNTAAAIFARWAEIDPEAALKASATAGDYSWQARRGVLITWLNQDHQAAADAIAKTRLITDFRHIKEYLSYEVEQNPTQAAKVVDYLAEVWPGSERRTLRDVAKLWSNSDPQAACDWAAKIPSGKFRQGTLYFLAGTTAKINGKYGLTMANHIENKTVREKARDHAIYWWGVTAGGISAKPGRLPGHRDVSSGFPDDWSDQNIQTYTKASMENFARYLPDIVAIAKDDHQREMIYRGAIDGAAYSKPSDVTSAVLAVSDEYIKTAQGARALNVYARRWKEKDMAGLRKWSQTLPAGIKKDTILKELNSPLIKP